MCIGEDRGRGLGVRLQNFKFAGMSRVGERKMFRISAPDNVRLKH